MRPLISIALCTYNPGEYLVPLLDSLLEQTWRPIEIVCCDDKSTDHSVATLRKYENNHPGIFRIIENEKNLGYIRNFEKCLSLCQGQWIAIADHDDTWKPEKMEVLHNAIGDALMVYSDSLLIDENGQDTGKKISDILRLTNKPRPEAYSFYDFTWGHTSLINRELLSYALPVPGDMPYDSWLAFTAASVSEVRYVDEPLTNWRQHGESFSATMYEKNKKRRENPNWKFEEYLEKKQRLYLLAQNKYGPQEFMNELHQRYAGLEKGFSWSLFFFLVNHQKKLFPVWRRNYLSRLNEFRKMARAVRRK